MYTAIRQTVLPPLTHPLDYDRYRSLLWELSDTFSCLQLQTIGTDLSGQSLYGITLGSGPDESPTVLYVGGLEADDWISTAVLLRFVTEYCLLLADGGKLYSIHLPSLAARTRICICPMLRYSGGEGLDGGGFSALFAGQGIPERCPEGNALMQYVRFQAPSLLLTVSGTGEPALCSPVSAARTRTVGRLLSRMLLMPHGYTSSHAADADAVAAWFTAETKAPGFSLSMGLEPTEEGYYKGYASLREALFSAPLLV